MSIFAKQDEMAEEILTKHRGKVLAIVKATRAGATFSLLKRACELKQKTVIVAPYIEIFERTVKEVAESFNKNKPRVARISKNEDICRKVAEKAEEYPKLKRLPFLFRPSCSRCEYNDPKTCRLQEILVSDWDILGLTYAKLRALSISKSATALDLLGKIRLPDNLMLDEFVTGIVDASPSLEVEEPHEYLKKEFNYESRALGKHVSSFETIFWSGIANLALFAEVKGKMLTEGKYELFDSPIADDCGSFFKDNFAKCWNLVERLALEERNTVILQELLQIVASDKFFIIKKKGKVSVKPVLNLDDISRGSVYLRDFAMKFFSKGKFVALVDACLPDLDLERSLGLRVEAFDWGDPLHTNQTQLIICDTRKIGETDFFKSRKLQAELKETITVLSQQHGSNTILLATQNIDMWRVIEVWRNSGVIPKEIMTTYYRSRISRGVTPDPLRRILILIGAPYLPKEAYLPETYVSAGQTKDLQTAYKKSDMKSAFINLIGRVKDPKGQEKSIVYALGITAEEARAFVMQEDIQSPLILQFLFTGADANDFMLAGDLFLSSNELTWNDLEKELPVLVRILKVCRLTDEPLTPSDIASGHTNRVTQFIESYPDVLRKLNIEIIKKGKSIRLQTP